MRYGFINNFSQLLAADLAIGATTMTLDGGGALLSAASADLVYTLTLDDGEGTTEIVHVTGAATNTLNVVRAQEGTTAAVWPTGSTVEMRLTAGVMAQFQFLGGSPSGTVALALGNGAIANGHRSVALSEHYAEADGESSTAMTGGWATGDHAVAIGFNAAYGVGTVIIGGDSEGYDGSIGIGFSVYAQADKTVCVGPRTSSFGGGAISAGHYASAYADYSVALGAGIETRVAGGYRCAAVPYLASNPEQHYANGFPGHGAGDFAALPVTRRTSPYVVMSTDALDLSDGAAFVTLSLPAGVRLFIDSIDVVIVASTTPGGAPEIRVGPDDVTPAAYLAATAVTGTAVGERQTHAPLVGNGVTTLRAETVTAGTGTLTAKIVFRGYVMEL